VEVSILHLQKQNNFPYEADCDLHFRGDRRRRKSRCCEYSKAHDALSEPVNISLDNMVKALKTKNRFSVQHGQGFNNKQPKKGKRNTQFNLAHMRESVTFNSTATEKRFSRQKHEFTNQVYLWIRM
jgi:hypothetical protein